MKSYLCKNYKYVILSLIFVYLFSLVPSILELNYQVKGISIIEFFKYIFNNRNNSNMILNFIYQFFNTKLFIKVLFEAIVLSFLFYLLNNFYKTNILFSLSLVFGLGFKIILNVIFSLKGVCFFIIPIILYLYILKNIYSLFDNKTYNYKYVFLATILISLFGKYFSYLILVTYIFTFILFKLNSIRNYKFFLPIIFILLTIILEFYLNYQYYSSFKFDYSFLERISYNLFSNYELIYHFFFDKIFLLVIINYFILKSINKFNLIGKLFAIVYTCINLFINVIYVVYRNDLNWIISKYIIILFILSIILLFILNYHLFKDSFKLYIWGLFLLILFVLSFIIYSLLNSGIIYGFYFISHVIFILYILYLYKNIKCESNINYLILPVLIVVSCIVVFSMKNNKNSIDKLIDTISERHEYMYIYTSSNINLFDYYEPLTDSNNLLINLVNKCDSNYVANIIIGINDYNGMVHINPNSIDYYYKKEDIPPYFIVE